MILFPFHDATGSLYPELDTREVSVDVMVHYLNLSRITIWKRALRGDYGNSVSAGAWFAAPRGNKRKLWTFRPAVLWRVKQWGRFAQVGFRPLDLEGRVRLYHCDPAITAAREQAHPTIPAEFAELTRQMAGCNLGLMGLLRRIGSVANDPITFPQESAR